MLIDVVNRLFEILRYRPGQDAAPMYQTYEVPCLPDWVVLDALNAIKDDIDPTRSHRWSCRMSCAAAAGWWSAAGPCVPVPRLCAIRVEPASNFPIVCGRFRSSREEDPGTLDPGDPILKDKERIQLAKDQRPSVAIRRTVHVHLHDD